MTVLRLDDRGVGASTGRFETSSTADRAGDMRAALAFLRTQPRVDPARVALVGLSEGGVIAPMLAATDTLLRGIVIMGAPDGAGREIAQYQIAHQIRVDPGVPASKRDSALAARMRVWDARTDRWARFFVTDDVLATARRVSRVPVLVLHGENDSNVPPAHARALRDAFIAARNRDVTVQLFPGVSHPMLVDPIGTPEGELYLHSADLAPEVIAAAIPWLVAHLR